ncbi:hypothetical protein D3C77_337370 [compost metagenome]
MHGVVYLLVDGRVYAVASGQQLLTGFLKQLRTIKQLLLAHIWMIHHSDDESTLPFCLQHKVRISLICLFRLRRQRTFNIEGQSFIVFRFCNFVLFQHTIEYKLLPFNCAVERLLVKLSLAVKSGVGGRKLRQPCQIRCLGDIELIQVRDVENALSGSFNAIYLVAV